VPEVARPADQFADDGIADDPELVLRHLVETDAGVALGPAHGRSPPSWLSGSFSSSRESMSL
jgi:hypothetical protein